MSDVTVPVKVEVQSFHTTDGVETLSVSPSESRRKKANWYIWMKADGSGILVIDSRHLRVDLPANSPIREEPMSSSSIWCTDSACPLRGFTEHEFGKGCRLH